MTPPPPPPPPPPHPLMNPLMNPCSLLQSLYLFLGLHPVWKSCGEEPGNECLIIIKLLTVVIM